MENLFRIILLLLLSTTVVAGGKALSERVVTMNTKVTVDEEYNKALDEMQGLDQAGKAKLSAELEKILIKDKEPERRANAASALGDMCSAVKTNDVLISKAVADKDKRVRQAVASGLSRCDASSAAIKTLKALLKDKDDTVKTLAEVNLEKFGTPESKAALSGK